MKICIISGPYNPGKCGISDYIQLISNELQRQGHEIIRISKNKNETFSNLVSNLPKADLYSIQFAPYAFSSNGHISSGLFDLAQILSSKKTHLNFHEIWIGAYPRAKFIERFNGWRQKRKINTFVELLNPDCVTCSNSAALDRLNSSGIEARYLYLFGNIPYIPVEKKISSKFLKFAFLELPMKISRMYYLLKN